MKFTNGLWLVRDNFDVDSPACVYDYKIADDQKKVSVFAPYKQINGRADTTDVGASTIEFTAPQKNILGVKLIHFDQLPKNPSFHVNDEHLAMETQTDEKNLTIASGDLTAKLPLDGTFKMQFFGNGKLLTASEPGMQGEINDRNDGRHYMREALNLDVNEKVYGLGERFTNFVKNGQSVDIVNKDAGTGSEQTYKNIPFYITNHGYGIFVDQPEAV